MDTENPTEELLESELGTLEYWENCYKDELKQFVRFGDPGEIWFGEDILKRIIKWMNHSNLIKKEAKIIDLGCGNGMMLIELANEGFSNLTGVDYSENAILLCKKVAEKHNLRINFKTCDILIGLDFEYDIILDKGTYDAITLSSDAKISRSKYMENVYNGLKTEGIFIITSCNWTESELVNQFKFHFSFLEKIRTPQFQFGGKVGNIVTICIFKKYIKKMSET